jgi:hypothetical protein
MYLALGRAEPAQRITSEAPGFVSPMPLTRVLDARTLEFGAVCRIYASGEYRGSESIFNFQTAAKRGFAGNRALQARSETLQEKYHAYYFYHLKRRRAELGLLCSGGKRY